MIVFSGLRIPGSIRLAGFAFTVVVVCASARAQTAFSDGFEGTTLNPFWAMEVFASSGSVNLSNAFAHSGTQSVQVNTTVFGGAVVLAHHFPSPLYGTVSAI